MSRKFCFINLIKYKLQAHNYVYTGVKLIYIYIYIYVCVCVCVCVCGYVDINVFDKTMWLHKPQDISYWFRVKFSIVFFPCSYITYISFNTNF